MTYTYSLPGQAGVEFENGVYEGSWKAGKRDGFGVLTWADGTVFTGIWKNDNRHKGKMRMAHGNTYIGYFQDDKLQGLAKLLLGREVIFEGNFDKGICSSVGKLLYPNGDIYYGQHKLFTREGQGKMVYFDGHGAIPPL